MVRDELEDGTVRFHARAVVHFDGGGDDGDGARRAKRRQRHVLALRVVALRVGGTHRVTLLVDVSRGASRSAQREAPHLGALSSTDVLGEGVDGDFRDAVRASDPRASLLGFEPDTSGSKHATQHSRRARVKTVRGALGRLRHERAGGVDVIVDGAIRERARLRPNLGTLGTIGTLIGTLIGTHAHRLGRRRGFVQERVDARGDGAVRRGA